MSEDELDDAVWCRLAGRAEVTATWLDALEGPTWVMAQVGDSVVGRLVYGDDFDTAVIGLVKDILTLKRIGGGG